MLVFDPMRSSVDRCFGRSLYHYAARGIRLLDAVRWPRLHILYSPGHRPALAFTPTTRNRDRSAMSVYFTWSV